MGFDQDNVSSPLMVTFYLDMLLITKAGSCPHKVGYTLFQT